jgi:hypothetical protein
MLSVRSLGRGSLPRRDRKNPARRTLVSANVPKEERRAACSLIGMEQKYSGYILKKRLRNPQSRIFHAFRVENLKTPIFQAIMAYGQ